MGRHGEKGIIFLNCFPNFPQKRGFYELFLKVILIDVGFDRSGGGGVAGGGWVVVMVECWGCWRL